MNIKETIKNKGLGYWICAGASVLAIVTAIVVFATYADSMPQTTVAENGWLIGLVLLIGVAVQIVATFVPVRFMSVISVICYGAALGVTLNKIPDALAAIGTGVNYTQANIGMCVFYLVGAGIVALASVVACFFAQTKDGKALI